MSERENMELNSSIEQAIQRPQLYWNGDGIPETIMGANWILWGVTVALPVLFPHSRIAMVAFAIFLLSIAATAIFMGPVIRWWKERVTYRRTGYLEFRKPTAGRRLAWAIAAVIVAIGFGMVVRFSGPSIREWLPASMGVVISLVLLRMGWRVDSKRLMALSPLVAAAAFATLPLGGGEISTAAVLLCAGLICVFDGMIVHRSYLKAHPAAVGE